MYKLFEYSFNLDCLRDIYFFLVVNLNYKVVKVKCLRFKIKKWLNLSNCLYVMS